MIGPPKSEEKKTFLISPIDIGLLEFGKKIVVEPSTCLLSYFFPSRKRGMILWRSFSSRCCVGLALSSHSGQSWLATKRRTGSVRATTSTGFFLQVFTQQHSFQHSLFEQWSVRLALAPCYWSCNGLRKLGRCWPIFFGHLEEPTIEMPLDHIPHTTHRFVLFVVKRMKMFQSSRSCGYCCADLKRQQRPARKQDSLHYIQSDFFPFSFLSVSSLLSVIHHHYGSTLGRRTSDSTHTHTRGLHLKRKWF